jgi:hypothetical protein
MNQAEPLPATPAKRWLVRGFCVLAALAGWVYSYDFGRLIGGPFVGVVLALNGAVFCSVVAGALAERLCNLWPEPKDPPQHLAG